MALAFTGPMPLRTQLLLVSRIDVDGSQRRGADKNIPTISANSFFMK
jgi:hypothetical protein